MVERCRRVTHVHTHTHAHAFCQSPLIIIDAFFLQKCQAVRKAHPTSLQKLFSYCLAGLLWILYTRVAKQSLSRMSAVDSDNCGYIELPEFVQLIEPSRGEELRIPTHDEEERAEIARLMHKPHGSTDGIPTDEVEISFPESYVKNMRLEFEDEI